MPTTDGSSRPKATDRKKRDWSFLSAERCYILTANFTETHDMMDPLTRLQILSTDSQYDLACACGSGNHEHRKRTRDGSRWLYPVPLAAGGRGIMFKTLLSNCCVNDCKYCPLRGDANAERCSLTPEEAVRLFLRHHERQWLLGLFLSSGVCGSPDRTMDHLIAAAEILRRKHHYRGYIHLKIIPGASEAAMEEALRYSSAVSLNIEVPGRRHFQQLSDRKDFDRDIVAPLRYLARQTAPEGPFSRVRCTTQFIVGASDETDREIIRYMDGIYNRLRCERSYFSAYQPGLGAGSIPGERDFTLAPEDRLTREHRLYQVDWLLRRYRFTPDEMEFGEDGNLSLAADPKQIWAARHPEFFPVNANQAAPEALLRVPGLGPVAVDRILQARQIHRLTSLDGIRIAAAYRRKAAAYLTY